MKRIVISLLAAMFASCAAASAQEVRWTADAEQIMKDVFVVTVKAQIPQGYHIYDMKDYEVGANPTVIAFDCSNGAKPLGKTSVKSPVKIVKDETLGLELGTLEGTAVFAQNIKVSSKKTKVKISAEWMMCSESSCSAIEDTLIELTLVRE